MKHTEKEKPDWHCSCNYQRWYNSSFLTSNRILVVTVLSYLGAFIIGMPTNGIGKQNLTGISIDTPPIVSENIEHNDSTGITPCMLNNVTQNPYLSGTTSKHSVSSGISTAVMKKKFNQLCAIDSNYLINEN